MKNEKIEFYDEVIVNHNFENKNYVGKRGVVLGVSREDDICGYSVFFEEEGACVFFLERHVKKREKNLNEKIFIDFCKG